MAIARSKPSQFASPLLVALLAAGVWACGADTGTTTGAPKEDGGPATSDAATDATTASDGAAADAGSLDAGSNTPEDIGPEDAGSTGPACHPTNPAKGPCPAGQHCIWSEDTLKCEVDGEHLAGEDCSDNKGCKVGICVKNDAGESKCAPHCLSNLDCQSNICNGLQGAKGKVCEMGSAPQPQCNPLSQNCKEAGHGCFGTSDGFVCKLAGKAKAGEACPDDASCAPGLLCVGKSSSAGVCRSICNQVKGAEPSCGVGVKCTPYQGSNFVGYCEE